MMRVVMKFSGELMLKHPGQHIVSPLFNHFSLDLVPGLGSDYAFWGAYSRNLLARCDRMIVLCFPGWQQSTGVADEIEQALAKNIPITYVPMEAIASKPPPDYVPYAGPRWRRTS
jgi:hypothetical protein